MRAEQALDRRAVHVAAPAVGVIAVIPEPNPALRKLGQM